MRYSPQRASRAGLGIRARTMRVASDHGRSATACRVARLSVVDQPPSPNRRPLALILPKRPGANRSDYPVLNPSARAVARFSPACTLPSPSPGCATGIFLFFRRTPLQGRKRWYYHSCLFSVPAPPFARERPAGFLLRCGFFGRGLLACRGRVFVSHVRFCPSSHATLSIAGFSASRKLIYHPHLLFFTARLPPGVCPPGTTNFGFLVLPGGIPATNGSKVFLDLRRSS